jgi:hypothetical protein
VLQSISPVVAIVGPLGSSLWAGPDRLFIEAQPMGFQARRAMLVVYGYGYRSPGIADLSDA